MSTSEIDVRVFTVDTVTVVNCGDWRLFLYQNGRVCLFHRTLDPFEYDDLSADYPEVVAELRTLIEQSV